MIKKAAPKGRKKKSTGRTVPDPECSSPQTTVTSDPSPAPAPSLDDAIALLMRLESSDSAGYLQFKDVLRQILDDDSLPADVRDILMHVAATAEELSDEESVPDGDLLVELSGLLELAANKLECSDSSRRPSVPAAPVEAREAAEPPQSQGAASPTTSEVSPQDASTMLLPSDIDADLMGEFATESKEYIEQAEVALLSLETYPEDQEAVNTIFRAFHTIKGTSGFLGLQYVSEMAHRAESLLSRVRDGQIRCTGGYADLALRAMDALGKLIQSVQKAVGGQPITKPDGYDELMTLLQDPEAAGISSEGPREVRVPRLGDILVAEGKVERETVDAVARNQNGKPLGVALVQSQAASVADVVKALRTQQSIAKADHRLDSSVRVSTQRLDRLIEMVGELVIAHSMVAQDEIVAHSRFHDLMRKVTRTGKIVRELQDLSMSMRMVPLRATFSKMGRLVRDLAHKSDKMVNLVTKDNDTEIDRNMVDIIHDLLVHMVRNAVDHGIETPEERKQSGKESTGTINLSAFHSGGNVVVEIKDDGKGLNRNKISEKAIVQGLITSDKGMSDKEIYGLIFTPGFSTSEQVTDISGRGVGMDVVRKGVEALHGSIEIFSEPGKGTTFSIRLPLTLAITDGMLVRVGGERYIIPTISIQLNFQPIAGALSRIAGRGEMVMLRGELMPVYRLHRLFKIEGAIEDPTRGLLVVVGDGERRCTLLVDELLGQQQVVAKSLGEGLGKIKGISGGAILGDGKVGLILDPSEIAVLARQGHSGADGNGASSQPAA